MDGELVFSPHRRRLPNRRNAITQLIIIGNITVSVSIGFGPDGRPQEVFLSGAKDGSGMAAILDDASVAISVALQHGVPPAALAKSIARIPERLEGPPTKAASIIGAALDQLLEYESA
jgi:ribonucleoside-diphosphate reductase alpha chain